MRKTASVVVICLVVLLAIRWLSKDTTWLGFYYPQGDLTGDYILSPTFKTQDACFNWAESQKSNRHDTGSYECGKNCKLKDLQLRLYVCDETIDS
jgi:hypothetical protein